jgi:hypothetical protein
MMMGSTHSDDWKYDGSTLESATKFIKSSTKIEELWRMTPVRFENEIGKYKY